jgi:PTS system glucose-specific IIC component
MNFHKQKVPNPPVPVQNLQPKEKLGTRIMAVFSKLSKAFLLPIALLPIAGVFLGVGAAITSNATTESGI